MSSIKNISLIFSAILFWQISGAQTITVLHQGTKASFRGLSAVDDLVVWVSGSNGTVGRSTDGGKVWQFIQVKGFEKTDFRDIEAFDSMNAVIMGIDCPGRIFKTSDGGQNWRCVFEDSTKGMFMDAMSFDATEKRGLVIGDAIEGKAFTMATNDQGENWIRKQLNNRPPLDSGEAFFASSGTNIKYYTDLDAVAVSGGVTSHLLYQQQKIKLPMLQGKESTGANSIALKNASTFMIVGGDFMNKDSTQGNFCFTKDAGKTWRFSIQPPSGYRSCVEYLVDDTWITCGLNGVDITTDDGLHFTKISDTGFHVCRKSKKGKKVFLAGGGGRIGVLQ